MQRKTIPETRLIELKKSLDLLPPRSAERKAMVREFGELYGVSSSSVYRALRRRWKPKGMRRSDAGSARILPTSEMEKYCQIIAAMKIRTRNKKGRHLPTTEAIRLLEQFGIETPQGLVKVSEGVLKKTTVNRYLKNWGYDLRSMDIEPVVVRFQAKYSNECWHFDLSPSDLKDIPEWPEWIEHNKRGRPVLMLYSAVDDRSGAAYQEYSAVFGEDVESALRFLFRAMTSKKIEGFPFQGIPQMLYMDNGPIARSLVFQRVMELLGIQIRTHLPKGKDGRRTTTRSKGKVERPFRTVKELHETLYHFHKPKDEQEANQWMLNFILRYNEKKHRSEGHSRIEDWIRNIPPAGLREMCSWERFCTFSREPERRKVGSDAMVNIGGGKYQLHPELAGRTVILWWGLFDSELYVESEGQRFGPFQPTGGPIPLRRFRKYKKTRAEKRADAIEVLAREISLSRNAFLVDTRTPRALERTIPGETKFIEFNDPDPFDEFAYSNTIEAKKAISDYLGMPLSKLSEDQLDTINTILSDTLKKTDVMDKIKICFRSQR